ncbi:MAG: hypothetical protein WHS87_03895 [Anaerolineales bacterium]
MIPSIRRQVLWLSGQDVGRCQACLDCDSVRTPDMDVPLGSLIQMALLNDEEVFSTRTLWSEEAFQRAGGACKLGLDLQAVLQALRQLAGAREKAQDG